MKLVAYIVALVILPPAFADSPIPATEVIKDRYDVVVYGVADTTPKDEVTISHTGTTRSTKLHLLSVRPYRYLPDISPRYFWAFNYQAYVTDDIYAVITKTGGDFATKPRFWGIRRTLVFGDITEPISTKWDNDMERLESAITEDLKDPTRVRPLDLSHLKDKLSLRFTETGQIQFANRSEFSVWLHEVAGEYLSTGKSDFCYYITGFKSGQWVNFFYGLSGPSGEAYAKFNLSRRIRPGESVSWERKLPEEKGYEGFRVEVTVYPDESRNNGIEITSNKVSPK